MDNLKLNFTTNESGKDEHTFIRGVGETDGEIIERAAVWLKTYLHDEAKTLDHGNPPTLEWLST